MVAALQAGRLGLGPRRRALAQPDPDVDARRAEVERVGVALGAVAEDGDLLVREQPQVGVVVVVDGGGHSSRPPRRFPARPRARTVPRGSRGSAIRPVRCSSMMPNGRSSSSIASSLSGVPATMRVRASVPTSRILASKIAASSVTWPRLAASARTVASISSRSTASLADELRDLDDVDELVELLGDLLERRRLGVDHDRHPGEALVVGRADGQREDVEPPAGEQAGTRVSTPGLFSTSTERMWWVTPFAGSGISDPPPPRPGPRMMSSFDVPAGTIGYTFSR